MNVQSRLVRKYHKGDKTRKLVVPIRVNEEEKAAMALRASKRGMHVSEYLRMLDKENETEGDAAKGCG